MSNTEKKGRGFKNYQCLKGDSGKDGKGGNGGKEDTAFTGAELFKLLFLF